MAKAHQSDRYEVVTFKAPTDLVDALKGVENRSEFIRAAVLSAIGNTCPLCRGAGILTPKQLEHWNEMAPSHSIRECQQCHQTYLHCEHEDTQA